MIWLLLTFIVAVACILRLILYLLGLPFQGARSMLKWGRQRASRPKPKVQLKGESKPELSLSDQLRAGLPISITGPTGSPELLEPSNPMYDQLIAAVVPGGKR